MFSHIIRSYYDYGNLPYLQKQWAAVITNLNEIMIYFGYYAQLSFDPNFTGGGMERNFSKFVKSFERYACPRCFVSITI